MATTALQEWFFNEIRDMEDFSSPSGNSHGKELSSPNPFHRKKSSGTSEKDPSEPMSLFSAEEIPEEAFLPGSRSENPSESQSEKTVSELYDPPSDGSSEESGSSGKEQNSVSDLYSSTENFSAQRSDPAENGTAYDRDGETLLPGSFPETDHTLSAERPVAIRTITVPVVHEKSWQSEDALPQSSVPFPEDFPLTVTTISNPEMFPDESGKYSGTVSYVPHSGRERISVLSVPDSSITTGDGTMDIIEKGFLSFPVADTTDPFLFSVPGGGTIAKNRFSDTREDSRKDSDFFISGANEISADTIFRIRNDHPVFPVPGGGTESENGISDTREETVFPVPAVNRGHAPSSSVNREMGNEEWSDTIQEEPVSSVFLTDEKQGSAASGPEEEGAVLPADENQKGKFSVSGVNTQEYFSIPVSGNGYDPGEMGSVLPEMEMESLDPEKLSLYEQALRYLNGEIRSAEGKNLSGFQYPVKKTFPDTEDESSAVNKFDSTGNIPGMFSVSEMDDPVIKQLSVHIRTGGLIPGNFSSVSVPGPMFAEKNSEYSAGELLSERMKESIKVLNKINACCENLKQIVNEGMNI